MAYFKVFSLKRYLHNAPDEWKDYVLLMSEVEEGDEAEYWKKLVEMCKD